MKKEKLLSKLESLALPGLLCVLGLVLLLTPDAASALAGKLVGWGLLAVGIVYLVDAVTSRIGTAGKLFWAVAAFAVSSWLLADPLALVSFGGRLVGVLFAIKGGQFLLEAQQMGLPKGRPLTILVCGCILALMPVASSRLVLRAMGLGALVVGVLLLVKARRTKKWLDGPDDPNIIDAL